MFSVREKLALFRLPWLISGLNFALLIVFLLFQMKNKYKREEEKYYQLNFPRNWSSSFLLIEIRNALMELLNMRLTFQGFPTLSTFFEWMLIRHMLAIWHSEWSYSLDSTIILFFASNRIKNQLNNNKWKWQSRSITTRISFLPLMAWGKDHRFYPVAHFAFTQLGFRRMYEKCKSWWIKHLCSKIPIK